MQESVRRIIEAEEAKMGKEHSTHCLFCRFGERKGTSAEVGGQGRDKWEVDVRDICGFSVFTLNTNPECIGDAYTGSGGACAPLRALVPWLVGEHTAVVLP